MAANGPLGAKAVATIFGLLRISGRPRTFKQDHMGSALQAQSKPSNAISGQKQVRTAVLEALQALLTLIRLDQASQQFPTFKTLKLQQRRTETAEDDNGLSTRAQLMEKSGQCRKLVLRAELPHSCQQSKTLRIRAHQTSSHTAAVIAELPLQGSIEMGLRRGRE